MNYELAKKLKDAGYKQHWGYENSLSAVWPSTEQAYAPTLSELIEACGNPFMLMWFEGKQNSEKDWEGTFQAFNDTDSVCSETGEGSTPEEAVANLWLKLNKK